MNNDLLSRAELIGYIKANGFIYANTLETFPAVDATAVIRCKDCKHSQRSNVPGYKVLRCCYRPIAFAVAEDHYCGYGRRGARE